MLCRIYKGLPPLQLFVKHKNRNSFLLFFSKTGAPDIFTGLNVFSLGNQMIKMNVRYQIPMLYISFKD